MQLRYPPWSQIVINLVSNGIKFCGGGDAGTTSGVVVVRVSVAPPADDAAVAETVEPLPGSGSLSKRLLGDPTLNRRRSQAVAAAALATLPLLPPPPSCRVLIEVEDNGPGVPADVAARLFAPFTQVSCSRACVPPLAFYFNAIFWRRPTHLRRGDTAGQGSASASCAAWRSSWEALRLCALPTRLVARLLAVSFRCR